VRRRLGEHVAAADQDVGDAFEDGVAGLRSLRGVLQTLSHALRRLQGLALHDLRDVFQGSRVGGAQAAGDGRELVAHHVGEEEGEGPGRGGQAHQTTTFKYREVLSYGVDLFYVRAAP
jgi:hypothetical protein